MDFTELEKQTLQQMVEARSDLGPTLSLQIAKARVISRKRAGRGFITKLQTDESCQRLGVGEYEIAHAFANVVGLEHGMGIILFQLDGYIDEIESWTSEPDKIEGIHPEEMDFELLTHEAV